MTTTNAIQMFDIKDPDSIEVVIGARDVLWVNIDEICRLRVKFGPDTILKIQDDRNTRGFETVEVADIVQTLRETIQRHANAFSNIDELLATKNKSWGQCVEAIRKELKDAQAF